MSNENNKPLETLRDGAIKATIWKNQGEKGPFYSVEFSRTYLVGEDYKDASSFSGSDILKVAHLASRAYETIATHRRADAKQAKLSEAVA